MNRQNFYNNHFFQWNNQTLQLPWQRRQQWFRPRPPTPAWHWSWRWDWSTSGHRSAVMDTSVHIGSESRGTWERRLLIQELEMLLTFNKSNTNFNRVIFFLCTWKYESNTNFTLQFALRNFTWSDVMCHMHLTYLDWFCKI